MESGDLRAEEMYTLVPDIDCGDLKLDKFGNLYYIDRTSSLIGKLSRE